MKDFAAPIGVGFLIIVVSMLILFVNLDFYNDVIVEVDGVVFEVALDHSHHIKNVYVNYDYDGIKYENKYLECSGAEAKTLKEGDTISFLLNLDTEEIRSLSYNPIALTVFGIIIGIGVIVLGCLIKLQERRTMHANCRKVN